MIELKVEEYCHECPSFEPDVDMSNFYDPNTGDSVISDKIIRCHYHKRCANMVRYLERKLKNDDKH